MTYFLEEDQAPARPRGNDIAPTSWFEGMSAAASQIMRDTNANFQRQRDLQDEAYATATPLAKRLGVDTIYDLHKDSFASMEHLTKRPETVDDLFMGLGPTAPQIIIDMAREQALADPSGWKDVDLTDEGMQKRATARRIVDDHDETDILDMMPGGRGTAEFVGGMIGMVADVRQIPFLMFGGGSGSLLKVAGREAALNMAAEAVTLPSRFETAKELGKPDPSIVGTLGMAAAGGAILGGGIHALGRAISYYNGRSKTPKIPGVSRAISNSIISAAEDALARGEDPVKAVTEAFKALPVEPPPSRPPLIEPRPQEAPQLGLDARKEQDIGDAETQFAADFPEMLAKYPLARVIQKLGGIKAKRLNPATGVSEPTFAAQELANMGVTQRTHPFMFRKDGHSDFDNIVASEHPGINETIPFDSQTGYFNRDDLISALGRELSSGKAHPLSGEIEARLSEIEAIRNSDYRTPTDDFLDKKPADDGFFVDINTHGFGPDDYSLMASGFDEWAERRGFSSILTRQERAEILDELDRRGGDAEYLVERTLEREQDYVDGPEESQTSNAATQGAESAGDPIPFPIEETGGRAGSGGREPSFAAESTPAGQQSLVPGIEPITHRQRLEAAQNAPKRGMDRPMDTGLFDMGARQQMDMFSEPTSKEARVIQDSIAADIRDQAKKGEDFLVDMEDGKGERLASTVLDDLDQGDIFSARLDLCGKGPS